MRLIINVLFFFFLGQVLTEYPILLFIRLMYNIRYIEPFLTLVSKAVDLNKLISELLKTMNISSNM